MTTNDLIDDLRSRINPAYSATLGTESYERRLCVEALESQRDRLEVLEREHQEFFERWHNERRKREAFELAMTEIAAHHEEQRDLWANEWNADADQASYHEERRNLALFHLMTPNVDVTGPRLRGSGGQQGSTAPEPASGD